jgi:hypothetical protein
VVLDEEASEDERGDGRELDEDVDRGSRGVLKWVSYGVSDNSGLVSLRALSEAVASVSISVSASSDGVDGELVG